MIAFHELPLVVKILIAIAVALCLAGFVLGISRSDLEE